MATCMSAPTNRYGFARMDPFRVTAAGVLPDGGTAAGGCAPPEGRAAGGGFVGGGGFAVGTERMGSIAIATVSASAGTSSAHVAAVSSRCPTRRPSASRISIRARTPARTGRIVMLSVVLAPSAKVSWPSSAATAERTWSGPTQPRDGRTSYEKPYFGTGAAAAAIGTIIDAITESEMAAESDRRDGLGMAGASRSRSSATYAYLCASTKDRGVRRPTASAHAVCCDGI